MWGDTLRMVTDAGKLSQMADRHGIASLGTRSKNSEMERMAQEVDNLSTELKELLEECIKDMESTATIIPALSDWLDFSRKTEEAYCFEDDTETPYEAVSFNGSTNFFPKSDDDNNTFSINGSDKLEFCPSYISVNEDATRIPQKIMEVKCTCRRPCGPEKSQTCTSITSPVEVFRQGKKVVENIMVGCACLDKTT